MIETDRQPFFAMLADVYAFYRANFSDFAGRVWWAAMRCYDLAAVQDALGRHSVNPDTGQYLPKPADVVRMLQGGTQDSALAAWAKVDRAMRQIGAYRSVVFDDALIHRVLHDMGGWPGLGRKTDDEWPFVAKEFENRYRGYRTRSERPEYPPVLIGIAEAQNSEAGRESQPPVLIGRAEQARRVLAGGTRSPLVEFHHISQAELLALTAPKREAA
ncbi:DUF6475 domain-containing protein [Achromobacter xylosoxidans]